MPKGRTIALRALNELSALHKPSYVALRYLLHSQCAEKESDWIKMVPIHKMAYQEGGLYFDVVRFKKFNPDETPEIRHFLIPSPFTALAEAEMLNAVFASDRITKSNCVYSYLKPPTAEYGRNYEHYICGYRRRNDAVTRALNENPGHIALVADIKSFYPSINKDSILRAFQDALGRSAGQISIRAALNNAERILNVSPNITGVPLGPCLSHVLGDLALKEVDDSMISLYQSRYFRYVDDIIVVTSPTNLASAQANLTKFLDDANLEPNPDKWDIVESETWITNHNSAASFQSNDFNLLLLKLKTLAVLRPTAFREIYLALNEEGIFLPLERFYHKRPPATFAKRIKFLYASGVGSLFYTLRMSRDEWIKSAVSIRRELEKELELVGAPELSTEGMAKRFQLQKARFLLNRLLYMSPTNRLESLSLIVAHRFSELIEHKEILYSLATGDATRLIQMPGNTVVAYAMHHRRRGLAKVSIPASTKFSQAVVSSVSILLLFDVCNPVSGSEIDSLYLSAKNLFQFCVGNLQIHDLLIGQNYLSELAGLSINKNAESVGEALLTAFSVDEEYLDEGLALGGLYYR